MPHWPIPLGNKPIDLELTRIKALLTALGSPHNKLPPVVLVAGTNGKGSTTAFLKTIFQAAGLRVHTYTSPHLVNFNERINILGTDIEDNFLYEVCEESRIIAEKINIQPTFFEGTTAAAFLAFSKVKSDIVILEIGLGGRLDATNVIDRPAMSIITSISMDHTEFLGDNIGQIAFEKAGIIKPNCPCVISQQHKEAEDILLNVADINNSDTYAFKYDWMVSADLDKQLIYESTNKDLILPPPNLQGTHQYINAGNAITAALNLKEFKIKDEHIAKGLTQATWPARLQKLLDGTVINKLPKNFEIWVDGAHNEAAAHALSIWLDDQPKMPTYMIFGMTKGRNCQSFLSSFKNRLNFIAGVLIEAEPSSYNGEYISNEAAKLGFISSAYDSIDEAIDAIVKMEPVEKARIIVTGSLYLAGDILYQNQRFRRY